MDFLGQEFSKYLVLPSQAYIAIIEDALDQLTVLGDISPDVGRADKPSGEEITRILRDQKALELRFQDLIMDQEKLKSLPNKTKYKEGQMAILDVTNELQRSTQCQENEASELQRELQKELANERKLLEEETSERNQVIQQLKDTIQEINALTNSEQKYIKKETKAHENSVKQRCQARESALGEEEGLKMKCLSEEERAHEKIVDYLTRQRNTLEVQIQEWMTKYEEDTEAKANELDALKQKRTQDLDKFEELVAAYEELEKIVEEDRQNKQREAEERRVHVQQATTKSAKKTPKKGKGAGKSAAKKKK
ncbi:hypothetical protein HDU67_004143 [Dinochytrium kinnereticum]|nr:hypothetical protein HDU67_004143 [Dinochytrium kinnereticum]